MKYLFLFFIMAWSLQASAQINRCKIISMTHFGGNLSDLIYPHMAITHPDGSFSIGIQTTSGSGNINTGCNAPPATFLGGYFFRTYTADYSTLLAETCWPNGSNFRWPTPLFYRQSNGDTILIGAQSDPLTSLNVVIERRNGNTIWNKVYGGSNSEGPGYPIQLHDGGFLVVSGGWSDDGDVGMHYGNPVENDVWVLRLDTNGNKLWSRVLGGSEYDFIRTAIESEDGSLYLFGGTTSTDHDAIGNKGATDLWIVKLDSVGNTLWHKCLGGSGNDGAAYDQGVFAVTDGGSGFYVLNRTASQDGDVQHRKPPYSPEEDPDYWLLHIDSAANILWETTFGTTGWQYPTGLCRGTDSSLWCMGHVNSLLTPDGEIPDLYGDQDGWVVHTDTLGNIINQRTIGCDGEDYLDMIHPLPDGSVLIGGNYPGTFTPGSGTPGFPAFNEGDEDIFLVRLGPGSVSVDDTDFIAPEWQLFPNPAKDALTIEVLQPLDGIYTLRIVDVKGSVMHTSAYKNPMKISTKQWASGTYYVNLIDAKGNASTKKLIIQH